jgi:hypothetical protein
MSQHEAIEFATRLLRFMLGQNIDSRDFASNFRKADLIDGQKLQYLFDPNNSKEFEIKCGLAATGDKDTRAELIEWAPWL